jgi:hypothetical protein
MTRSLATGFTSAKPGSVSIAEQPVDAVGSE